MLDMVSHYPLYLLKCQADHVKQSIPWYEGLTQLKPFSVKTKYVNKVINATKTDRGPSLISIHRRLNGKEMEKIFPLVFWSSNFKRVIKNDEICDKINCIKYCIHLKISFCIVVFRSMHISRNFVGWNRAFTNTSINTREWRHVF